MISLGSLVNLITLAKREKLECEHEIELKLITLLNWLSVFRLFKRL